MSDPSFGLLLDPIYLGHDTGLGHPERPSRYQAVSTAVETVGLAESAYRIEPRRATSEQLETCHTERYVALVEHEIAAGVRQISTGDTTVGKESFDVGLRAAGGVVAAVDWVAEGSGRRAFCAVRPPGHHARPAQAMGFCLFNNVAVGARHAQRTHGVDRVLIADWDVHHGNGTQDMFYDDPSVLFFSTHQSPWYPGTGDADETGGGAGQGLNINRPLPSGSGSSEVLGAFREDLVAAASAFKPELVMISAGFDSRKGDPLGEFTLSDDDFAALTDVMREIAEASAGGRVVSVLEGGYSLSGLRAAVEAHLRALAPA